VQGLSVNAKLVGESRLEVLDVSSALGPTDTLASAAITCSVYSGTDSSPASLVGSPTVDSTYNVVNLPLLAAGVAGVIYQLVLTVTMASSYQKTFTFFLAVVPDAV